MHFELQGWVCSAGAASSPREEDRDAATTPPTGVFKFYKMWEIHQLWKVSNKPGEDGAAAFVLVLYTTTAQDKIVGCEPTHQALLDLGEKGVRSADERSLSSFIATMGRN